MLHPLEKEGDISAATEILTHLTRMGDLLATEDDETQGTMVGTTIVSNHMFSMCKVYRETSGYRTVRVVTCVYMLLCRGRVWNICWGINY